MRKIELSKNHKLEYCLIGFFFLGMLASYGLIARFGQLLSLIAQLMMIMRTASASRKDGLGHGWTNICYVVTLLLIGFIGLSMAIAGGSFSDVASRVLSLVSVFGCMLFIPNRMKVDALFIIAKLIKLYTLLAILIIIDALIWYFVGLSIWSPDNYVSLRFAGPFLDSNYMAFSYGIIATLAIFFSEGKEMTRGVLLSIICILLAGSWSTILLLPFTFLIHIAIKPRNMFVKQVAFLALYGFFIAVYSSAPILHDLLTEAVHFIISDDGAGAAAKVLSFDMRVSTQVSALRLLASNPLGFGPHSIIPLLGLDTHNSFIGMFFELGVFGLVLTIICIPARSILEQNRYLINVLTSFVFLSAFMLNIHYQPLFALVFILAYYATDLSLLRASRTKTDKQEELMLT